MLELSALLRTTVFADGRRLQEPQSHHQPTAARLLLGPGLCFDHTEPGAKPIQDPPPSLPATGPGGTLPVLPAPLPPITRIPSPTPPTRQTLPRLPEPVVEPDDDSLLRSWVEHYTSTDWEREQRVEPLCSATIRFLSLRTPSPPPDDLLDYIACASRPLL